MSNPIRAILLGAAVAAASSLSPAQTPVEPAQPPSAGYQSAFEGYRRFEAGEVQDWRQSNDTVRDIGGWRAYAREIQGSPQPAVQAPAPTAQRPGGSPAPAPRPSGVDPHQGHRP